MSLRKNFHMLRESIPLVSWSYVTHKYREKHKRDVYVNNLV